MLLHTTTHMSAIESDDAIVSIPVYGGRALRRPASRIVAALAWKDTHELCAVASRERCVHTTASLHVQSEAAVSPWHGLCIGCAFNATLEFESGVHDACLLSSLAQARSPASVVCRHESSSRSYTSLRVLASPPSSAIKAKLSLSLGDSSDLDGGRLGGGRRSGGVLPGRPSAFAASAGDMRPGGRKWERFAKKPTEEARWR